jgi:hypothetical protein
VTQKKGCGNWLFILEVWNDSIKGKEIIINKYKFDKLDEARKSAGLIMENNDKEGLDYAYFIVNENDDPYDISDYEDTWKERSISDFLLRVAATTGVNGKTYSKIAERVKMNAVRDWKPDDSIEEGEVTPKFNTWNEFIRHTTEKERLLWCKSKASISNRKRLLAGTPAQKIKASDVWKVLEASKGKCFYCGSLALEHLPSVNWKAISWAYMGRRIGALHHISKNREKDYNDINNLRWACFWCNTWAIERRKDAEDHGGYYK